MSCEAWDFLGVDERLWEPEPAKRLTARGRQVWAWAPALPTSRATCRWSRMVACPSQRGVLRVPLGIKN